jgi:Na+/H+ antiporter NhaC
MKIGTVFVIAFVVIIFAAVAYTALQVKSAVDSTKTINATKVMYESPIGQAFAPFAPVILITFGVVCFLVFMVKKL